MIYLTEIKVTTSDNKVKIFDGGNIIANSFEEAEVKAKKMNPELKVIGELVAFVSCIYDN